MHSYRVYLTANLLALVSFCQSSSPSGQLALFIRQEELKLSAAIPDTLVTVLNTNQKVFCLLKCLKDSSCFLVTFESGECRLFDIATNSYEYLERAGADQIQFYVKSNFSIGNKPRLYAFDPSHNYTGYPGSQYKLVAYMPFVNSTKDIINGNHLTIITNGTLTADRFGSADSALLFQRGHGSIPDGMYMRAGGFTLMLWFKFLSRQNYQRVFDFNDWMGSGIYFCQSGMTANTSLAVIVFDVTKQSQCGQTNLNEWTHFAVTYNPEAKEVYGYFNGTLLCTITQCPVLDIITPYNFIGGGSYKSHGVFDEIKYFSDYLSVQDIQNEMSLTQPFVVFNP